MLEVHEARTRTASEASRKAVTPTPTTSGADGQKGRRRYFDRRLNATVVQVLQGDFYVSSRAGEILATVLGSCVSACIRDPITRCGGMNHFLLPESSPVEDKRSSLPLRYGSFAMEQLINDILSRGGMRERLEIKVFGGANVIRGMSNIGSKNAEFVKKFLHREGFKIAGEHLRGVWPRKVQFHPLTGQVLMREIKSQEAKDVFKKEIVRRPRTVVSQETGTVELFD